MRKWGGVLVVILAWAFAAAAWAQADVVAQGEALVRAGRYAEAYQLLAPHEDKLAGDVKFDYLLARSALETGKPSQASFIYERILAVEPNFVGVRLEMGRAYLAMGDYARAKLEFETVLRFDNLPPDLRQQAQIYGKAAEDYLAGKKLIGFGYLEYGYGYDSNPLSVPKALERSDHYQALAVGGELVYALAERFSAFAGADIRSRWHNNIDIMDSMTLDGRFGFGFAEGANNVRIGATVGRYRLDNIDTRDAVGLTLDYRFLATKQDQLSLSGVATRYEFIPPLLEVANYDYYQAAIGWLHGTADGRGAFGVTLLGGLENATSGRIEGDKPFVGGRLTLQRTITEKIGAFLLAGAQYGKYPDGIFAPTREDTLYDALLGLSWSFAKAWTLRPQVSYLKNDSNLALFEYEKTDVSLNLRLDF